MLWLRVSLQVFAGFISGIIGLREGWGGGLVFEIIFAIFDLEPAIGFGLFGEARDEGGGGSHFLGDIATLRNAGADQFSEDVHGLALLEADQDFVAVNWGKVPFD